MEVSLTINSTIIIIISVNHIYSIYSIHSSSAAERVLLVQKLRVNFCCTFLFFQFRYYAAPTIVPRIYYIRYCVLYCSKSKGGFARRHKKTAFLFCVERLKWRFCLAGLRVNTQLVLQYIVVKCTGNGAMKQLPLRVSVHQAKETYSSSTSHVAPS